MVPRAQCTLVLALRTHTTSLRLGQPVPRAPQITVPVAIIAAKGDPLESVKEVRRARASRPEACGRCGRGSPARRTSTAAHLQVFDAKSSDLSARSLWRRYDDQIHGFLASRGDRCETCEWRRGSTHGTRPTLRREQAALTVVCSALRVRACRSDPHVLKGVNEVLPLLAQFYRDTLLKVPIEP